jgi:hypothetical protein
LNVSDFDVVNLRRKFETAHGLPDVVDSEAAEIPLDLHLNPLHLRLTHTREQSEEQKNSCDVSFHLFSCSLWQWRSDACRSQ